MATLSRFVVDTHSYTLTHTAAACVEHLATQGCTSVEFLLAPGHLWPSEIDAGGRQALRRVLADTQVKVAALNIPNFDVNLGSDYPEMRAYTLGVLEGAVQLAGDLGAPIFVVGPGRSSPLFPAPRAALLGHLQAALDRLVPLGARCGVAIGVENVPYAFVPRVDDLLDVLDNFDDQVGFVWDVANSHFIGEALAPAITRGAARLRLVHASDTTRQLHRHDRVGAGTVPFAEAAPLLAELAGSVPLVLEVISTNPDVDIPASAEALQGLGWGVTATA